MDLGKYVAVGVLAMVVLAAVTYEAPLGETTKTEVDSDQLLGSLGEAFKKVGPQLAGGALPPSSSEDAVSGLSGLNGAAGGAEFPAAAKELVASAPPSVPATPALKASSEEVAGVELERASSPQRPEAGGARYVVKAGQTLSDIAAEVLGDGGRWREIHRQNLDVIPDPNRVLAGTALSIQQVEPPQQETSKRLEGSTTYVVVKGDTLYSIAKRELGAGARWREVQRLNGLESEQVPAGAKLNLPPR